jgi:hypothetical protein
VPVEENLGEAAAVAIAGAEEQDGSLHLVTLTFSTGVLAGLRLAIKTDPSDAMAHNNLARLLLMGPKELRDPKAALPLARRAVELTPKRSLTETDTLIATDSIHSHIGDPGRRARFLPT